MRSELDAKVANTVSSIARVMSLHPDVNAAIGVGAGSGRDFSVSAAVSGSPEELAAMVWSIERRIHERGPEFEQAYRYAFTRMAEGWDGAFRMKP